MLRGTRMKPRKTDVPEYLIFAIEIKPLFSFNISEWTQFNCCREWPIEFSKSFDHALSASLSLFLVLLIIILHPIFGKNSTSYAFNVPILFVYEVKSGILDRRFWPYSLCHRGSIALWGHGDNSFQEQRAQARRHDAGPLSDMWQASYR